MALRAGSVGKTSTSLRNFSAARTAEMGRGEAWSIPGSAAVARALVLMSEDSGSGPDQRAHVALPRRDPSARPTLVVDF